MEETHNYLSEIPRLDSAKNFHSNLWGIDDNLLSQTRKIRNETWLNALQHTRRILPPVCHGVNQLVALGRRGDQWICRVFCPSEYTKFIARKTMSQAKSEVPDKFCLLKSLENVCEHQVNTVATSSGFVNFVGCFVSKLFARLKKIDSSGVV